MTLLALSLNAYGWGVGSALNNPGNIKHSPENQWLGASEVQSHPIFVKFDDVVYGFRAMYIIIQHYHEWYGIETLGGIIMRYAPPDKDDNNTANYIIFVSTEMNVPANRVLDFNNYDEMADLMIAMTRFEQGDFKQEWYSAVDCGLISNGVKPNE